MIILVVLGHSLAHWTGNWFFGDIGTGAPILGHISNWIGTYHTAALTAVSGLTYEYIVEKRGGYFYSNLIMKKVKRLLLPYLFVSILWVIPLTSFVIDIDADYIVNKFILGKSPAQLWFLLMLFDVFVLFFPLRYLIDKSKMFYVVFSLLYFVADNFGDASNNYFQFFTALRYLSFFALGHLVYRYRDSLFTNAKCNLRQPHFLSLLALIHIVAYIAYLQYIPGTRTILMLYLNFGGCLTAMAILLYIGERVNNKSKLITALKEKSFAIYLLHQQIIYYILFYFNGLLWPWFHVILNFVVSLSLSLVLSIVFHKSRLLRVYFLGRRNS